MDTGIVVAFAGDVDRIPQGWELCDGRMLDRTDSRYQALFGVIGTRHGGAAAPLFQLPDYRGRFLRGVDHGAGRDPDAATRTPPGRGNTGEPGDKVGSVQGDSLRAHSHATPGYHLEARDGSGFHGAGFDTNSNTGHHMTHDYGSHNAGGSETRPQNAYVHWIIKL